MSTAQLASPPVRSEPSSRTWSLPAIVVSCVVLLAHLPLLQVYFRRLWDLDHYSFAPLLVLGVIGLIAQRWMALPASQVASVRLPLAAAAISLVLLAIASWLVSPWLAMISFVISSGLLLRHFAGAYWKTFLPVWALLILLIRPPLNLDVRMIQWLQNESSRAASGVLEMLALPHLMDGNVIRLPGREFLVEEACSGVHSLFALLTAAAFYAAFSRLPLIRAIPLMISAVFWAGLMNVLRITAIVLADAHFHVDLTSGWPHEAMGFLLFFLAVLLLILTDQLLQFFVSPIADDSAGAQRAIDKNSLAVAWNRFVLAPGEVVVDRLSPAGADQASRGLLAGGARTAIAGVLCLLSCGMAAWQFRALTTDASPTSEVAKSLELIAEQDLPAEVEGCTRISFQQERLRDDVAFSEYSKTWAFAPQAGSDAQQRKPFLVSLDYPFTGWHDLTNCYIGQGWNIDSLNSSTMGPRDDGQPMHVTEAILSKPAESNQLLLFTGFDATGVHLSNPAMENRWRRLAGDLTRRITRPMANGPTALSSEWRTTTQFQLLTEIDGTTPTAEELESARTLFVALCQQIKQHLREKSEVTP